MYLLRIKSRHHDTVRIVEHREVAIGMARDWVGEHRPQDSCSTQRTETDRNGRFHAQRSSSFGRYEAWVITPDEEFGEYQL